MRQTTEVYFRPVTQTDAVVPDDAVFLAGGRVWFNHAERLSRRGAAQLIRARDIPAAVLANLTKPRNPICGVTLDEPRLLGVLNVTPDSFSDGGRFSAKDAALAQAQSLIDAGADFLDIGGESTRPRSDMVAAGDEAARVLPVIDALVAAGVACPISVDTRKAAVAARALATGAGMINDVSALTFDPLMAQTVGDANVPVCLMHALGDPKTMQDNPAYDDVLLDVYDYLAERIAFCEALGIKRQRIVVDPGIGFGKKPHHNLALIKGLSLFHALGCAVLLGVSRKRFIGTIGNEPRADRRAPGSIAIGLEAVRQGVQLLRVHDISETKQALALWQATR